MHTINAHYIKHPVDEFNGNPLTESIQVIEGKDEIFQKLTRIPVTDIENLSSFYQMSRIGALRNLHVPHQCSAALYHKIMELTLNCYSTRNPLDSHSVRTIYTVAQQAKKNTYIKDNIPGVTTAPSCLAHGPSGSSKSTTIKNVLSLIPQVIQHTTYEGEPFRQDQLVWVSLDCPSTPSPKALASNFFKAVDRALGTNYNDTWEKSKLSVDARFGNMQLIALTHCIGFVHIDELQFLLSYAKTKDAPTLQTIEALFNKIGIPVLITTTSAGLALFEGTEAACNDAPNLTTPRRMLSEWEFKFNTYPLASTDFNNLIEALYPRSLCSGGNTLDESFRKTFHHLSAGLPAVMTRLARLNHEYAIKLKSEKTICEKLLQKIYRSQFSLLDKALTYLRSGNIPAYEKEAPRTEDGNVNWSTNNNLQDNKKEASPAAIPSIDDEIQTANLNLNEIKEPTAIEVGLGALQAKELNHEK